MLPSLAIQPVGNGVQSPESQEPEPITSLRKRPGPSRRPGGCRGDRPRKRAGMESVLSTQDGSCLFCLLAGETSWAALRCSGILGRP